MAIRTELAARREALEARLADQVREAEATRAHRVNGKHAELPEDAFKARDVGGSGSKEVKVLGGSVRTPHPQFEEHGALQDEGVLVGGLTHPEQESFDAVPPRARLFETGET